MRGLPMLEAQPRTAVRVPRAFGVGDPQQNFLSFLEVAAEDLGEVAVGDADLHGDGSRLALRARDEDATRERALTRQLRLGQVRVVLGSLLGRENGADLLAIGLTNARGLDAALAFAEAARNEVAHLLGGVLQDRLKLLLLLGCNSGGQARVLNFPSVSGAPADCISRLPVG